jgi:F0F1-type ATP synthase assembly protein I
MTMGARPEVHLTSQRDVWWMLLPAAAIAVVTGGAVLSSVLFGDDLPEGVSVETDWVVPLVGIGGIVVAVLVIWAATVMLSRARERWQVLRVFDTAVARWPQYATEAQWRQVIAKEDKPSESKVDVIVPAGIVLGVGLAIAIPAGFSGMWGIGLVVMLFCGMIAGMVVVRRWNLERERRNNRTRRERLAPYPSCWLSADAFYHEDWGLITLDLLTDIQVVPAAEVAQLRTRLRKQARDGDLSIDLDPFDTRLARSGWSLLQLTLDDRVVRTLWHWIVDWFRDPTAGEIMPISVLSVRVPPGREPEAAEVVKAVTGRWLRRTTVLR